ncbi:MAG: C25 family peptidase C-terminal domain-containing protein, partial [Bacteroidota bacterium]
TSFTVNCDFNDALVSLTRNNAGQVEILGTGYIAGGTVDITIPGFTAPDTMFVTVTAFNHITYSGEVLVIASSGPYVIYNSKVIHDPTGNNNGLADYNEDITFDITLENVGVNLATSVTAVISTTNPDVTITDNTDNFGDIAAGTTSTVTDAYAVSIADGIADQTSVLFSLTATDGAANSWPSQFTVICNAPDLGQTYINVNDAAGNGDGLLDPGETLDINVNAVNSGHAPSVAANCVLTCSSPYVTINTTNISLGAIGVGGSAQSSHNVTIDAGTPTGTSIDFTFTVTAGAYSDVFTVSLPVGLMVEDWESNSFLSYAWENISSPPWFITTTNPYEGTYCSQSGNLNGNAGQSILIIDLDVIAADNVSFYKKVSCEEMSYGWYWDFLEFDIDNTLKGQWAGEVAWSYEEYPVTTGNHELKWIYEKDAWYDMGSDCAWLDYIVLPPHSSSTVITGTTGNPGNLSLEVFPNPVSTSSTISLSIDNEATVSILIFNVLGDKTMSIMEKKMLPEGSYSLPFDASGLANGIYTCRMIAGEKVVNKKFIIVK